MREFQNFKHVQLFADEHTAMGSLRLMSGQGHSPDKFYGCHWLEEEILGYVLALDPLIAVCGGNLSSSH